MTDRRRKIIDVIEKNRARVVGQGIGQREWESLENIVALARFGADLEDEKDENRRLKTELAASNQTIQKLYQKIEELNSKSSKEMSIFQHIKSKLFG